MQKRLICPVLALALFASVSSAEANSWYPDRWTAAWTELRRAEPSRKTRRAPPRFPEMAPLKMLMPEGSSFPTITAPTAPTIMVPTVDYPTVDE